VKRKFKIISRDSETCEHDTGVFHSVGIDCDFVESMMADCHMHETDPQHDVIWHDPKIMVAFEDLK